MCVFDGRHFKRAMNTSGSQILNGGKVPELSLEFKVADYRLINIPPHAIHRMYRDGVSVQPSLWEYPWADYETVLLVMFRTNDLIFLQNWLRFWLIECILKMMKDWPKLIISVLGCELVGFLATPFTISAIPIWYATLNKPFFAPPNWLFGPVWSVLYLLMGVSFFLIWKQGFKKKKSIRNAGMFFLVQLGLNFIWSPIFFGLRLPELALIVIVAMGIFIILTIRKFYQLSKWAAYLLVPYLLWVSFATLLNAAIVLLN